MLPPNLDRDLLILDVDGVLNSTRSMLLTGPAILDHDHLDPVAVQLLDQVCETADPNVAIISTWRQEFPDPRWWNALFARYHAPHVRVVACLPWSEGPTHRGRLLETFLAQEPWTSLRAVALDDSDDYLPHQTLVQVNADVGLSAANACELLEHLAPASDRLKNWRFWMPDPDNELDAP